MRNTNKTSHRVELGRGEYEVGCVEVRGAFGPRGGTLCNKKLPLRFAAALLKRKRGGASEQQYKNGRPPPHPPVCFSAAARKQIASTSVTQVSQNGEVRRRF